MSKSSRDRRSSSLESQRKHSKVITRQRSEAEEVVQQLDPEEPLSSVSQEANLLVESYQLADDEQQVPADFEPREAQEAKSSTKLFNKKQTFFDSQEELTPAADKRTPEGFDKVEEEVIEVNLEIPFII